MVLLYVTKETSRKCINEICDGKLHVLKQIVKRTNQMQIFG